MASSIIAVIFCSVSGVVISGPWVIFLGLTGGGEVGWKFRLYSVFNMLAAGQASDSSSNITWRMALFPVKVFKLFVVFNFL